MQSQLQRKVRIPIVCKATLTRTRKKSVCTRRRRRRRRKRKRRRKDTHRHQSAGKEDIAIPRADSDPVHNGVTKGGEDTRRVEVIDEQAELIADCLLNYRNHSGSQTLRDLEDVEVDLVFAICVPLLHVKPFFPVI